jgi:hypothetical protein
VRKNRNGARGAAQVKWNAEIMQYAGLERFAEEPARPNWQDGDDR